jgi:hypothetical protein
LAARPGTGHIDTVWVLSGTPRLTPNSWRGRRLPDPGDGSRGTNRALCSITAATRRSPGAHKIGATGGTATLADVKPGRIARKIRNWFFTLTVLVFVGGGTYFLVDVGSPKDAVYGSMQLPSTKVVHLPAGRVNITWTEDLDNQTVDIPQLRTRIEPVQGGQPLSVTTYVGDPIGINGVTHVEVAWTDVPREGDYRVSDDDYVSWAPNPQLLFGPPSDAGGVGLILLGATGFLLIVAIIATIVASNAKRRAAPAVTDAIPDAMRAFRREQP